MELMGVDVRSVGSADAVAAEVTRACHDAFEADGGATAVMVEQKVIGVKSFSGDNEGEG